MTTSSWLLFTIIFTWCPSTPHVHANTREILYAEQFFANDTDRFRTSIGELQPFGDTLMRTFTDYKSGVMFSGVFTNNTVLQREPHQSALYGTSDTTNTTIALTIINTLNGEIKHHYTQSMHNGDWNIILPQTYPNGGDYTLSVHCNHCIGSPINSSIYNITFGDVYFCSGQSNMNIELHFTFNRNHTIHNITQLHKYSNIRFFTKRPYAITDGISPYVIPSETDIINGKYKWHQSYDIESVKRFSATCWYSIQSLIDEYNMSDINFGLILSAVDGSKIQGWILNDTISTECDTTVCPGTDCGGYYNGMILPFINMTIKGVLWYQGENNVFEEEEETGGYGCLQKLMIDEWRGLWSLIPNTTDSLLPFGVVQLAPGTSEGHVGSMPYFRWSQSVNHGILPNERLLNVFMAQTYDIGDPWRSTQTGNNYPAPYDWNSTKWFLGPIHPRSKLFVGKRLAMGINRFVYNNDGIWNGALIKGCVLNTKHSVIIVDFNEDMLYDEQVMVQPFTLWYNESLAETVKYQSSIQILVEKRWIKMDGNVLSVSHDGYSVIIDVSSITNNGMNIEGVSYAWSDSPCCGDLNLHHNPCPLNMCPIVTSISKLPALPFHARIINNKCHCFEPQTCDGMEYELPEISNDDIPYTTTETSNTIRRLTMANTTEYICIMGFSNNSNDIETSIIGEYRSVNGERTYWIKTNDNYTIFGNTSSRSMYMRDNLICVNKHIKSPSGCDKWIDIDNLLLFYGKCIDSDIQILAQVGDMFDDDKIKQTLYIILAECCCLCFFLWIYCMIMKHRRNRRNRTETDLEQLDNLKSTEQDGLPFNPIDHNVVEEHHENLSADADISS